MRVKQGQYQWKCQIRGEKDLEASTLHKVPETTEKFWEWDKQSSLGMNTPMGFSISKGEHWIYICAGSIIQMDLAYIYIYAHIIINANESVIFTERKER